VKVSSCVLHLEVCLCSSCFDFAGMFGVGGGIVKGKGGMKCECK
jgi:hypothetical protein